jgi:endoglucanase
MTYVRRSSIGLALIFLLGGCGSKVTAEQIANTAAHVEPFDHHILVDQFGYRPNDQKVAVIRDPQIGYDSKDRFSPGPHYEVRQVSDGKVVFSGHPAQWNGGSTEASSGDRGWWFDFSTVTAPGRYVIYDKDKNLKSTPFSIDAQVYKNVLKASMRMFFYQRSGFAKTAPYAEECWRDDAAYVGKNQDGEAHDVTDRDNAAKVKDLSGGWFDAGDTNKYVTFAAQPVHQLLTAYELNPAAFTDDFNIPESGNGIPDILDEVKWETTWLKKMQYADGSVALKVGEIVNATASPPSSDSNARYYIPSCTSASISAAGMFAHASYVFAKFPALAHEALDLKIRAKHAWENYQSIAGKQTNCDTNVVKSGNADLKVEEQEAAAAEAAIYLFAITEDPTYDAYLHAHYKSLKPYRDAGWSRYNADQGEALLFYSSLPTAEAALSRTILSDKAQDVKSNPQIYGFTPSDDLYRAFLSDPQYHWGSNNPRANYGNTNMDAVKFKIAGSASSASQLRALETLHYFHGVNPFAMVYLTNMYRYGASNSANEVYHTWFLPNSKWSDAKTSECGPAPGYVAGGPNKDAAANGVPTTLSPPTGQPAQKSYLDWNKGWPDSAWAVTEPAIYYQSAYIRLLSSFAN